MNKQKKLIDKKTYWAVNISISIYIDSKSVKSDSNTIKVDSFGVIFDGGYSMHSTLQYIVLKIYLATSKVKA